MSASVPRLAATYLKRGKVRMADVHHILRQIAVKFLRESVLDGQLASPMQWHHLMQHQWICSSKKEVATCHRFALKI